MKHQLESGQRVQTPLGAGKIVYRRMKAPDYNEVDCYSVLLDSRIEASQKPPFPSANGTVFQADQVDPIE